MTVAGGELASATVEFSLSLFGLSIDSPDSAEITPGRVNIGASLRSDAKRPWKLPAIGAGEKSPDRLLSP
jgi:hypothetical protein